MKYEHLDAESLGELYKNLDKWIEYKEAQISHLESLQKKVKKQLAINTCYNLSKKKNLILDISGYHEYSGYEGQEISNYGDKHG